MIVRCVSRFPNDVQLGYLGPGFLRNQDFHITPGKEYVVFGLTVVIEPGYPGRGLRVEHLTDYGNLVGTPICLFEILDGTVSQYWQTRVREDGTVTLWPPTFYREFYHDDLSDGEPDVVEDFKRVKELIEAEALQRKRVELRGGLVSG
jgi:hypothetical protein